MRWLYDTPEGPRDANPQEIYEHAQPAAMAGIRFRYVYADGSATPWQPYTDEIKVEPGGAND